MTLKAQTKSMKNTVKHVLSNKFFRRKEVLVDLSYRCPIACPKCQRQIYYTNHGEKVIGQDLPLESIDKITDKFKDVAFGGQLSDPIHHPKFIQILEMCYQKDVNVKVQTASSFKPIDWYVKAFTAHPKAKWQFGIDGLPEQSSTYRINQDGEKLFKIMCLAKNHLNTIPIWQCIVFRYNENSLDSVKQMAKDNGLSLVIMYSSRWDKGEDKLKPVNKELSLNYETV